MYKANYAEDGTIKGFYMQGLHRDIPEPTLEITEEQHADYFARGQRHKVIDGVLIYVEPAEPTLNELKEQAWQRIKAERDKKEQSGVPYLGKVLDSDSVSVQRISVAVQAAQATISSGQVFALDWTMQDNTVVTMTAQQVVGMSVVLAQHSDGLHRTARELRERIEVAKTEEELAAIVWPEQPGA